MIQKIIENSIQVKTDLFNDILILDKIKQVVDLLVDTYSKNPNAKLFLCGNGGSAADAQHWAADMAGRFYYDRPPLNAEALHTDTSYLTAVANDYSFYEVYARMVKAKGRQGDVLVGLSTSGNSANVINALKTAKEIGMTTIAFTGQKGGEMRNHCDILINVPTNDHPRIQECHTLIYHIICQLVEATLFPKQ